MNTEENKTDFNSIAESEIAAKYIEKLISGEEKPEQLIEERKSELIKYAVRRYLMHHYIPPVERLYNDRTASGERMYQHLIDMILLYCELTGEWIEPRHYDTINHWDK